MSSAKGRGAGLDESSKPCRACTDFKTWMKSQKTRSDSSDFSKTSSDSKSTDQVKSESTYHGDCPLDKSELGRNTWSLLHTMAEYYPDNPTTIHKAGMKTFIGALSLFYPCNHCAEDFRDDLKVNEPNVSSRHGLSQYFCELHNRVNEKLGKPIFDCGKARQRWKDGWPDGRCD